MSALKVMTTVNRSVLILRNPTYVPVSVDTHWPLIITHALVCIYM